MLGAEVGTCSIRGRLQVPSVGGKLWSMIDSSVRTSGKKKAGIRAVKKCHIVSSGDGRGGNLFRRIFLKSSGLRKGSDYLISLGHMRCGR